MDEPTRVELKSMLSAGTPYSPVRTGVSLIVKSTEANVFRLCFSLFGPVLPMMLPLASSSYRWSIVTVTALGPLVRVIFPD